MRSLILLAAMMVAAPAYSQQRTFRASSIDLEQNERIDTLESRMKAVEASVAARGITSPVTVSDPAPNAEPVVVAAPVVQSPPISVRQPSPQPTSGRYTTEQLRAMIHAKRPGGWRGPQYADVSPRSLAKQHLVDPKHGFTWDQISGLSQDEALILHDLAPTHGNQIFPSGRQPVRSVAAAPSLPPMQTVSTSNPWAGMQSEQYGCANGQCNRQAVEYGCANGQCANPQSSAFRGGFFRRGLFR